MDRNLTPEEIERRAAASWDLRLARTEGPQTVRTSLGPLTLSYEDGVYVLFAPETPGLAGVYADGNATKVRNALAPLYVVYTTEEN